MYILPAIESTSTDFILFWLKFASFEDLIKYLRKNEVITVTKDMLQVIHEFRSNSNFDVQDFIGQHNFKIQIFLAAYMIALYPCHVFDSMGDIETRLTASSTALLTSLEAILDHVWTSANLNSVSCALIDEFPQLVATYFDDFQKWKEPDDAALKGGILNALRSLYAAARTLSVSDEEASGVTRTDLEDQILRLRVKLSAIGGQTELDDFDALLQAAPPSQVTSSPALSQYLTNEQLLQYASRLTRAAVFHNVRTQPVTNVQIAHELLIDPSFQFEDNFSIGGEGKLINQSFVNVFWSDLLEDLKKPEPSYDAVFRVLEDIRYGISDVAGDAHALSLESQTIIDINHIKTSRQLEVWSSCINLFTNIFYLVLRVQMQKREDEAKAKWDCLQKAMQEAQQEDQPQIMCDTIRFFSNYIDLVRIDASNARIRLLADVIKTHGVSYEQSKFQEKLDSGNLTLENTTEWLSNEIDNIKVKQLKQLVNGNMEALRSVHQSALVKLIVNPTRVGKIPEVLNLDLHRISYFSKQYQKLVNCATVMRVINRFMSPGGPQLDTDLESISRMVLASDTRKVEDVESIFDIIMQTPLQHVISSDHIKEMRIDMEKIFIDPYFDMLTIV
jgi:hypothetical protein